VTGFEHKKAALQERIETLTSELEALKAQRKAVKRHITIAELPEEERFKQLSIQSKQLIDTIKMVAYRAETAMVQMARDWAESWNCRCTDSGSAPWPCLRVRRPPYPRVLPSPESVRTSCR